MEHLRRRARSAELIKARDTVVAPTTQQDIARMAGVSQSVVSRVLGASGYVSETARAKVLAASDHVGYVPDAGARSLVTGRSNIIALVVANVTNAFYPYLFDKLALAVQSRGREVMLFNASGGRDVDELLPSIVRYKIKAAVVMTAALSSKLAAELRSRGVQVVMLNRYSLDFASSTVACDNLAGGRLVAEAFLTAKLSRLAYVGGGPTSSTNFDRRAGFVGRLAEEGLSPVFAADGAFSRDWGHEAAALLNEVPRLEGIFCADDDIAMGVCDRFRFEYRRRIPEELAVIGFDDVPGASWPPYSLSTVRQPVDEMIVRTLELLDVPPIAETSHVRIPGQFIRRQTF